MYNYKFTQEIDFSVGFCDAFMDSSSEFPDVISENFAKAERLILIFDQNVFQLHGRTLVNNLKNINSNIVVATVSVDEETKNLNSLVSLLTTLEHYAVSRRSDPIIAVGGGVLLDLVGMACSLYRRGIPFYKVPTTLLAMIDACLGAKTAVNHFKRRNRLGTFYPSIASYIDKGFLKTLPKKLISEGTGEILKIGIIKDIRIVNLLLCHGEKMFDQNYICDEGNEVMKLAILGMMESLSDNLWESKLKRDVDFGHTFSPNIEMSSLEMNEQKLSHGEAVALDVLLSCYIAYDRRYIKKIDLDNIISIMKIFNLRLTHPLFNSFNIVLEGFLDIQKHRNNHQHLPVPRPMGNTFFIEDLSYEKLKLACAKLMANN